MATQVKELEKDINKLIGKIINQNKSVRKERIEVEFLIAIRKLVEIKNYKELEKASDELIKICAMIPRNTKEGRYGNERKNSIRVLSLQGDLFQGCSQKA